MGHQPSGAFRNPQAHKKDGERQACANQERGAPAQLGIDNGRIKQHNRTGGPHSRTEPEAAVDDEVSPPAKPGWDEFLDGGIDGRVLAADARPGDETEHGEAPKIPGECGRGCRREIDG